MHAVCQGVFKQYTGLLTSTKDGNGKQPWFVGIRRSSNKMKIINMKLAQAKVPYEITRIVETFDDISDYKASMFRTFFLYLFSVLEMFCRKFISTMFAICHTPYMRCCRNKFRLKMSSKLGFF